MIDKMIDHFEEKSGNKYLVLDDLMNTKKFPRSMKKFRMELKKKLKQLMVAKKLNIRNIFKK